MPVTTIRAFEAPMPPPSYKQPTRRTANRLIIDVHVPLLLFRLVGGLLFVLSLGATLYELLWVWPRAESALHPARALLWNACLFAIFGGHHSALARSGVKARLSRFLPPVALRPAYVWVASILLLIVMFGWQPVGHTVWTLPADFRPLAGGLQLLGGVLTAIAVRVIDPLELAGLRDSPRGHLDIHGPYRVVRHPIYLGFLLIVWAPATMTGDRLWFAMLSTLYLVVAIPWEERSMQRALGDQYDRYRATVRWRVIPGIY